MAPVFSLTKTRFTFVCGGTPEEEQSSANLDVTLPNALPPLRFGSWSCYQTTDTLRWHFQMLILLRRYFCSAEADDHRGRRWAASWRSRSARMNDSLNGIPPLPIPATA